MNYRNFTFTDDHVKITYTRQTYHKTKTGKNWQKAPAVVTTEIVSPQFYQNYIQSIPFFNSRADYGYTPAGYLPTKLTTVSPYEPIKYIDLFCFEYDN